MVCKSSEKGHYLFCATTLDISDTALIEVHRETPGQILGKKDYPISSINEKGLHYLLDIINSYLMSVKRRSQILVLLELLIKKYFLYKVFVA